MKHIYQITLLLLLCFCYTSASPQSWQWVVNAQGDPQTPNEKRKIVTDNEGNAFIAGFYTKTFTLGNFSLTTASAYEKSIYLAKVNAAGEVLWLKDIQTRDSSTNGVGVALDEDGNCYVTGAIANRIFVSKYSATGENIWTNNFNEEFFGYGSGIGLDSYDNVYVVGAANNSTHSLGGAFLARLKRDGETSWTKIYESECHIDGVKGGDIAIDDEGSSYITGLFSCDNMSFDHITIYNNSLGLYEVGFVSKIDSRGEVVWANQAAGLEGVMPQVAVNPMREAMVSGTNYVYEVGNERLQPELVKYNMDGILNWVKKGPVYRGEPMDITTDYNGNIYLGGTSYDHYGGTLRNFYVEKYNRNGDLVWNREVKTEADEYVQGVGLDDKGHLYLTGSSGKAGLGVLENSSGNVPLSTFIAKFHTGSSTHLRPTKPKVNDTYVVCQGEPAPTITVPDGYVMWYDETNSKFKIHAGNEFTPNVTATDTFYVRRDIDNRTSWAKMFVVQVSNLKNFTIQQRNDTLFAPASEATTYKWYLGDSLLVRSTDYFYVPDTTGLFKVVVSDGLCSKESSIDTTPPPPPAEEPAVTSEPLADGENIRLQSYPNPSQGNTINIQVKLREASAFVINIYSANGLLQLTVAGESAEEVTKEVDISRFAKGLYFIEVITPTERRTFRFLKY